MAQKLFLFQELLILTHLSFRSITRTKFPDDLECEALNFQHIINIHSSKFKMAETSINSKLIESVRKVDAHIKPSDMLTPSMDCSLNSQSTFTPPSTHGCTRPDYIMSIQTSRQAIQAFKPPTRSRLYLDQQQITSAVSSSVEAITSNFSNLNTPPKSYSSINPIHRGIDCSRFSVPFDASQSNSKQNCCQFNNYSKKPRLDSPCTSETPFFQPWQDQNIGSINPNTLSSGNVFNCNEGIIGHWYA